MLDSIRSSAQSFGVKIAFGIIILVFVFWGVGNFNDRDYSNVVAVVNGEPIVATEFERAYQSAEEYVLRNNPGMTREQLAKEHFGRQVLRDLIQETLLQQEAARAGITVTPYDMRVAVDKIDAFKNAEGKFDPEIYKKALAANRLNPAEYERSLSKDLLQDKIFQILTSSAWVDASEALELFNFLREKRIVDYIFYKSSDYIDKVVVTEEEEKDWYDNNKNDFAIPAKVDVSYIEVKPENLVDKTSIEKKAIEDWYGSHKQDFETKEQIKAAHILVTLPPGAGEKETNEAKLKIDEARKEIENGAPFATVADKYNQAGAAGPGGSLGWLSRGETVPEFETAAFTLKPGELSEVIRTPFGLHLVLVEDKKAAGVRPLEEVREEIVRTLAFEAGSEKLHETLDSLIEDNILNKPLAESAARYGLKVEQSGLVDQSTLADKLGIKPESAASIMELRADTPLDTAVEAGDNYIILRVNKNMPSAIKSFEEVKSAIVKEIKEQKALEQAMAHAAEELGKFRKEPFQEAARDNSGIKTSEPLERGGTIGDFSANAALMEAVFTTEPGKWLDKPYTESGPQGTGAMLVRVQKLLLPKGEEFAEVEEVLVNSSKRDRREGLFTIFMQNLVNKAKVEITNPGLVDRTGR